MPAFRPKRPGSIGRRSSCSARETPSSGSDMTYTTIRTDIDDGILLLTLNRPEQMNAYTVQMADELEHVFRWVNGEDEVRAVIVTGAGSAFCAGMDLRTPGNPFGLDGSLTP